MFQVPFVTSPAGCRTAVHKVDRQRGTDPLRIGKSNRAPSPGGRDHGRLFVPSAPAADTLGRMSDVSRLIAAAAAGDPAAAAE